MEQFSFAILIILWISILMWGSKYIEWLWVTALGFMPFRLFVAPGIIVHEYSHALACLITGTKIHEIRLFKREGGHVKHDNPAPTILGVPWLGRGLEAPSGAGKFVRYRFFSQFLISFAPVFGCLACIWLLGYVANFLFDDDVSPVAVATAVEAPAEPGSEPLASFEPVVLAETSSPEGPGGAGDFGELIGDYLTSIWESFEVLIMPLSVNLVLGVFYLWLLLSLTVAMAPSRKDIMNSLYGIFAVTVLLVLISFGLAQDREVLKETIRAMLPMMGYTTAVMFFALAVTSVIAPTMIWIKRRL